MSSVNSRPRRRLSREQLRALRRQQAQKARKGRRTSTASISDCPRQRGPLRPHRAGVLATDPSAIRPPGPRRHPDLGRTHISNLLRSWAPWLRASQQLSPDLLPQPLALRRWHADSPPRSSADSRLGGSLSWPEMIPSRNIPGRRSTARAAIATRSAPPTRSRPSAGGTSGSSWPCWFGSLRHSPLGVAAADGAVSAQAREP